MASNKELIEQVAALRAERDQATAHLARVGERVQAFEEWCRASDARAHAAMLAVFAGQAPPADPPRAAIEVDPARLCEFLDWARYHAPYALGQFLDLTGVADPRPNAHPHPARIDAPTINRGRS